MDKLSGFDLDHIANHPASTSSSAKRPVGALRNDATKSTVPLTRNDPIDPLEPNASAASRRQSHTGSTRPNISQPTNRAVSGGKNGFNTGRNSLMQGLVSPPLQRELSSGRPPHNSLLEAVSGKIGAPRKQKPVGFKEKLKKNEGGIVKRRDGAVLARG